MRYVRPAAGTNKAAWPDVSHPAKRTLALLHGASGLTVTPACSSARRTDAATSTAPGVSPCTQIVSTAQENDDPSRAITFLSLIIRTARSAAAAGSVTTAPATCRDVSEPSGS